MSTVTLPRRADLPQQYTWDLQSIFATDAAWEAELEATAAAIPSLARFAGHLGDSPATLLEYFEQTEKLMRSALQVMCYASLKHDGDTSDPQAVTQSQRGRGLLVELITAIAFEEPELVGLGAERLQQLIAEEPRLGYLGHYFDQLLRRLAHVRSPEVEEVLSLAFEPLDASSQIYNMLADTDLRFGSISGSDGEIVIAQGTIDQLLASPERELRRQAWERYCDAFLSFQNSLAACLAGSVKRNVFYARSRRYGSALEAALDQNNIPTAVYEQTIDACRRHLPLWHRYWRIRSRALGVDRLQPYDIFAPLVDQPPQVSYPQAVEYVLAGLQPLGEPYLAPLRHGLHEQRWVDVYPSQGKRSNAYSFGVPGTHPFLLLNYSDSLWQMSILAHELGHSMHSYFTWHSQPLAYTNYSLFVAEVASNFNQALVRAHLLQQQPDRTFQIAVLEEAMVNFHRYLFIMPLLARFELECHQRVERGDGLSAASLNEMMANLFREGYGDEVEIDAQRVGITWAQFGHLHVGFYVYQYATGIAAANALADRVLNREPGAVDQYLNFLKAGSSVYPLEALQLAGVDMSSPEPIERAFRVLERQIDQLDNLID